MDQELRDSEPTPPRPAEELEELDRLWLTEMQAALDEELAELDRQVTEHLKRLRTNLRTQIRHLRKSVKGLNTGAERDELLAKAAAMEKTARRLAEFRTLPDPNLEDFLALLKRLAKANKKIGR